MSLNTIEIEVNTSAPVAAVKEPIHTGVVGSGDLEVMMIPAELGGKVKAKIVTPVGGFDDLWRRVLGVFVEETKLGDVSIEINDNNATPAVVRLRLQQTLDAAKAKSVA